MKKQHLSELENSVLETIQEKALTSFEILDRVEHIDMILPLYSVLENLNDKGVLKSYISNDLKYHIAQ
ncbi:hypothetical protein [Polaribacter dokdonensis]|jgi:hypothetical protein|uniref:Uncharacterized protein n=1 Tax=Polaribacter dokdonensis DSW-5 TaxID=1300348 RepID=A0A0N0UNW4_9FLAO|nr:hypothetical protein [Polaribacter dokdonensis]KOY52644.1 hypothetical protein I602_2204 [Polaribacter dokdonensis DSW-5]SEE49584.1 hypothetical protein SAMN05444353_1978 [Polaribacter dokdonensis DSW-5]